MAKIFLALIIVLSGCSMSKESPISQSHTILTTIENSKLAQVLKVGATGAQNNYTFSVTVSSPDTGCDNYADWWEVITPKEELIYRRVLLHSHVDEQPFKRTGGIVKIKPQQKVIIRVHMSSDGYSPMAQQGTVKNGFSPVNLPENFAAILAFVEPLPKNCAF